LLRLITGFEQVTSGNVIYDGRMINDVIPQKRDFGIVFQSYALFPNMTVRENTAFGLKMRKMPQKLIDERVDEILKLLGLSPWGDHYPAQLSGGQQQRVGLGRAIAIKPNVLLLDEPLSALDAKIRIRLRIVIKKLQQDLGITLIYVTHDQEEALAMADRIVIMRDGQIRQIGDPREVYKHPRTSFIAEFVGISNFMTCTRKNGVNSPDQVEGDTVYLAIRPEQIQIVDPDQPEGVYDPANIIGATVDVVTFLGPIVRITFPIEGEEIHMELPEKVFALAPLKSGDTCRLYFPPDAFNTYSELFRKLI
ncbi:MAG: ABC transporter ATP-binding protein, partial [Deltaproteobacteria bacterium]|nr:ABC transporter ATP-binding protein [Deltaproteobacteria bacterium]